jgi:hypothetical protein
MKKTIYPGGRGRVVVEWTFRKGPARGCIGWMLVAKSRARKRKLHIAVCDLCKSPAVYIDHFFPYYSDYNRCLECHRKEKDA